MGETRILVRLLRMYFPRNWEFGSALSKLRNLGLGGLNPSPRNATEYRYTKMLRNETGNLRIQEQWAFAQPVAVGRQIVLRVKCYVRVSIFSSSSSGMPVATALRSIAVPSEPCLVLPCFLKPSHKRHNLRGKKLLKIKRLFWFSLKFCSKHSSF
jgi:hypothetical protein